MSISESHYRTKLLKKCTEKNISDSIIDEIMLLFGSIEPNMKEEVAKRAIPLVEESKTEKEAINKIMQLVKQV